MAVIQPPASPPAPAPRPDIFEIVFRFFSTAKLGVCVLVLSALALGALAIFVEEPGTILRRVTWVKMSCEVVLLVLTLNVFAVTLSRYPWTRRQAGMLLMNTGLIVALAGTFLSTVRGRDGTITLRQGELTAHYDTGRDLLTIKTASKGSHGGLEPYREFDLPLAGWTRATERNLVFPLDDGTVVKIDRYFPKYRVEKQWREAPAGDPEAHAVPVARVQFRNDDRASEPEWIYDESLTRMAEGPPPAVIGSFAVTYNHEMNEDTIKALLRAREAPRAGTVVVVQPAGEPQSIDVKDSVGKPFPLEGGYTLSILKYLPNIVVGADLKAVSDGDVPDNPAVQIRVTGPEDFDRTEWLFHLKETPAEMGHIGLDEHFQFRYEFNDRLTIVSIFRAGPDQATIVISAPGAEGRRLNAPLNHAVPLRPGIAISILGMYEHPKQEEIPHNDAPAKNPAIHVSWSDKDRHAGVWIPFGEAEPTALELGEKSLFFAYSQVQAALPFSLELTEIRANTGSAAAVSTVRLQEPGKPDRPVIVSASDPLEVAAGLSAWKVFPGDGPPPEAGPAPARATFVVSYDPGRPFLTAGLLLAALGAVLMFGIARLSRHPEVPAAA